MLVMHVHVCNVCSNVCSLVNVAHVCNVCSLVMYVVHVSNAISNSVLFKY